MALNFAGNQNARIDFGTLGVDLGNQITVAAWINPTSAADNDLIFSVDDSSTAQIFALRLTNSSGPQPRLLHGGDTLGYVFATGGDAPYGEWSFLCGTFDGDLSTNRSYIYVGDLSTPATDMTNTRNEGSGTRTSDSALDKLVGHDSHSGDGAQFKGDVACIWVWTRVLSLAEIHQAQYFGFPGPDCVLFSELGFPNPESGTQLNLANSSYNGAKAGSGTVALATHCPIAFGLAPFVQDFYSGASPDVTAAVTGVSTAAAAGTLTALGGALVSIPAVASTTGVGVIQIAGGATITLSGIGAVSEAEDLVGIGGAAVMMPDDSALSAAGAMTALGGAVIALPGASATSQSEDLVGLGGALVIVPDDSVLSVAGSMTALGGAVTLLPGASSPSSVGSITISAGGNVSITLSGVASQSEAGALLGLGGAVQVVPATSADALAGDIVATSGITVILPSVATAAVVGDVSVQAGTGVLVQLLGVASGAEIGTLTITGGATVEVIGADSASEIGQIIVRGRDGQLVATVVIGSRLSGDAESGSIFTGSSRIN